MNRCHKCGTEWVSDRPRPGHKETCPTCQAYLHSCKNCRFYTDATHTHCTLPNVENVPDKHKFNFCDEFQFIKSDKSIGSSKRISAADSFENLFGGKLSEGQESRPNSFDKLFGD